MIGPLLRVLVISLVLLVAAFVLFPKPAIPPPELATEYSDPMDLPEFTLSSTRATPFSHRDLEDRFTLVFFGFTHCPDVCPLTMQVLAAAQRSIRANRPDVEPQVVLISVDPERDTISRMSEYVSNFDAAFVGATSPIEDLEPLLEQLGITVIRQQLGDGQYNMTHNPQVFVVGPSAQLIAILSSAKTPEQVTRDFLRIRARYLNGSLGRRRVS